MRGDEPAKVEERAAVHRRTEAFLKQFVEDYEMESDEGSYSPNEKERVLIEFVIHELIADDEFCALLDERRVKCCPAPTGGHPMSAPDVERLVEALKRLNEAYLCNRARMGEAMGDNPRWEAIETAIVSVLATYSPILAALSSRPDPLPGRTKRVHIGTVQIDRKTGEVLPAPLPASADIAGRLAGIARATTSFIQKRAKDEEDLLSDEELNGIIVSALETATAYRANPSGWIPVGERLPKPLQKVNVYALLDEGEINERTKVGSGWVEHCGHWITGLSLSTKVTYWQPLPPPPQTEGQKP